MICKQSFVYFPSLHAFSAAAVPLEERLAVPEEFMSRVVSKNHSALRSIENNSGATIKQINNIFYFWGPTQESVKEVRKALSCRAVIKLRC